MGLRIGEAATRSGLPTTTIRYYEDEGLIPPADRAANGYRTYTDRDIARLQLVARARTLQLPPAVLAELIEVWEHDRCGPVADRLATNVDQQLSDTRQLIAELVALTADLEQVRSQLARPAHDGPCGHGACVCLDTPSDTGDTPMPVPVAQPRDDAVACTLHPAQMPARLADWQQLLHRATGHHRIPDGITLRFNLDLDLAADLITTAAAEHDCCNFFDFTLHISNDHLDLHVTGPDAAQSLITTVFGTPDPTTAEWHIRSASP